MPKAQIFLSALVVNRDNFIAWTKGVLLARNGCRLIVGDNIQHEEAKQALDRGEEVLLEVGGRIVSRMHLDSKTDCYVETLQAPESGGSKEELRNAQTNTSSA